MPGTRRPTSARPGAASLDDAAIARWRLRSQHLVEPLCPTADDVVGTLLAVQAENPVQATWAVAARTGKGDPTDLSHLLETGEVLRTHVLRPTWHYVRSDDVGWLLDLTGPRVRKVTGRQLETVHGLDPAALAVALDTAVDLLAEYGELTRSRLGDELAGRGIVARGPRGMFVMLLLAHAELEQLICSGRQRDGEHTYALFPDRVPQPRRLDRDDALTELAVRYLAGHGPATERDLAYWASLPLGDVRRGLAEARDRLASFEHDGRTYWHAKYDTADADPSTLCPNAHLLQILDEYYRGYQDSRWVLDAAGKVPRSREPATGMALIDGQFVARARRTVRGQTLRFELEPFRPLTGNERAAIAEAAARQARFFDLELELVHS
jgi:hypothetical protein